MPKVTVYMPTHNRLALLRRSVESVRCQSEKDFELIVVNDGSSDTTAEYLEALSRADSRVRVVNLDTPGGACKARNEAIALAKGEFITGIDDDDFWLPGRLEHFVAEAGRLKCCSFLYAGDFVCSKSGTFKKLTKASFRTNAFRKKNIVGNQVFTTTARLKNVLFDVNMVSAQDYDCFYRLFQQYGVPKYLDRVTQIMDESHGASRLTTSPRQLEGYRYFIQKHANSLTPNAVRYQEFTLSLLLKGHAKISLRDLILHVSLENMARYLKYQFLAALTVIGKASGR